MTRNYTTAIPMLAVSGTAIGIMTAEYYRKPRNPRGFLSWIHLFGMVVGGCLTSESSPEHALSNPAKSVCFLTVALGWWLRVAAMKELGVAFSLQSGSHGADQTGGKIVNTGLYAYVRHPGYMSFLVCFPFAAALTANSWVYGLQIFGLVFARYGCYRAPIEEKALVKSYPAYKNYIKEVQSRIIPFIY